MTLLDFDALVRLNMLAKDDDIADWGIKGLVAAAIGIVDILANDTPVLGHKHRLAEDAVGVFETIVVESVCWLDGGELEENRGE